MSRLEWLEQQMEIQRIAIVNAKDHYNAVMHSFLLDKLTKEWCELTKGNEVIK